MDDNEVRHIVKILSDNLPSINSLPGLLLYAIFAYVFSMCCMFCSSRLGADIDIQKAMKEQIKIEKKKKETREELAQQTKNQLNAKMSKDNSPNNEDDSHKV